MKKEPLSIIVVKTLLAVIIFTGVGTIIVGGGWLIGKQGKVSEPIQQQPATKDEVTITTDKTEYEQGETINITVKNDLDKYIFFISPPFRNDSTLKFKGLYGNEWEDIILYPKYRFPSVMTVLGPKKEEKISIKISEIKKRCIKEKNMNKNLLEFNKYKVGFIYDSGVLGYYDVSHPVNPTEMKKLLKNGEKVYSNEFTIKEKSVLDSRCSEKLRGVGDCKVLRIGYEFDSATGKCIKEGINGCSFETPFKTLEECQKVCEKDYKKEISCNIEDIKNSKKFESLVITQAMQKDITDEIMIYLYFDHKLSDEEVQEIEQFGITIYKDSWIPPMGNHPLGFYLAKSKVENICVFDNIDLIKRVASGERTDVFHVN